MSLSGTKSGSLATTANCAGLSGNATLTVSGSTSQGGGVTAPAGLTGPQTQINTQGTCVIVVNDPAGTLAVGQHVGVFWTTVSGTVLNACIECAVTSASLNTPSSGLTTLTLTQSGGTGQPTGATYYSSSATIPTALPTNGTLVTVAISQDVTDGISIAAGSGTYAIQQLMATSTQPGLFNWLTASGGSTERLSALLSANAFDTWPTNSSQTGSTQLPSGGNTTNSANATGNWTTATTVTLVRCYNLGSTLANIGVSSSAATMQFGVIMA